MKSINPASSGLARYTLLRTTFSLLIGALLLSPVQAQNLDQAGLVNRAWTALGGKANAIEFTASGWDACLGQAWSVNEGWPAWALTDYHRVLDFAGSATSLNAQRQAGVVPEKVGGCGAQPGQAARPLTGFIDTNSAWPDQLALWLTPQGIVTLLENNTATIATQSGGWLATLALERGGITYTLETGFNAQYQVNNIRTWIDDTVYGDMEVLAEFGNYRSFDGISFPASVNVKHGGFTLLHLDIASANTFSGTLTPPERRGGAPAGAAAEITFEEIGPGVFAFNGPYQAVAVEFDEFSMVLDGLQSDARVQQLIAAVKTAIPGKPIRYVLTTHSHFDHASGLRQFLAEGAIILTHEMNVDFFAQALATPRTLRVDAIEPDRVSVKLEGINEHLVISDDAGQRVEFFSLGPSTHAADQIIALIPSINTIVEADLLQPWINPVFGGGRHPFLVYLGEELDKLGIDYTQFVPIHVPPAPPLMQASDLEAALAE